MAGDRRRRVVVNYLSPVSLQAALAIAAGNTAGPLVGAWLVRRLPGFRPSLSRLGDVLGLIGVAVPASAAISATVGVTGLFTTHVDPWARFVPAWVVWWLGDATGALLAAPLALTLLSRKQIIPLRRVPELAVLFSATVITCFAVFDGRPAPGIEKDVFAFVAFPLVLWGASRFEIPGAAGVALLIASMAVWETAHGFGPFVRNSTFQNAIILQLFVALLSAWGLILAAAIAERAHLIRQQAHREGLEQNERRYRPIVETAHGERQEALDRVALLSKAVEQTADSVLISDSAGHIEYVNPAFEATTGFPLEEVLGQTPRLLKSGHHGRDFYQQMWNRLLAGEPFRGTLVNRKKSGELYWANQTITPIKDIRGTVTHFVAVLKDVTEIRKYQEQEVQLRLARAVQERFYPLAPRVTGLDIAAASHPAAETGGDYFDFIEAPNGVWYVAIGDVSGHGFDAALIMALTRAYMRSFATLGMDVGEVLGRVNRAIIGDLEPERYITMLLVRLDVEAASMAYASAGHIPGALLDHSGGIDWFMHSTGIPLGLFPDATFETRHCQFRTDQILVLGTDGATETSDVDGKEFGRNGVLEYVRTHANETAQEIAAGVYGAARSFGAWDDQHDDITSVIVKVTNATLTVEQTPLPLETAPCDSLAASALSTAGFSDRMPATNAGVQLGTPSEKSSAIQ